MKNIYVFLLTSITFSLYAENPSLVIPEICEHVVRRTYFISRLERMVELLHLIKIPASTLTFGGKKFNHPLLKQAVLTIKKDNNLKPLFEVWSQLKEYRYIDDSHLMHEFTKLVISIPMQLKTHHPEKELIGPDVRLSLKGITYTEAVTLRLYYAQRLKRPLALLQRINCSKKDFFEKSDDHCNCAFISNYNFTHPDIKTVISRMESTNSLRPLIGLANEFEKLKLIQDSIFRKEFMVLIFTAYRNVILNNALHHNYTIKKNTLQAIAHLYDELENLPIEQILDTIDMLAEELPPLLEKYEFNSTMQWKAWLKKYWWIPPSILGIIALRFSRVFYPHNHPNTPPTNDDK